VVSSPVVETEIIVDGERRTRREITGLALSAGDHTICFTEVEEHVTPPCRTVTISADQRTEVIGRFEPAGRLEVTTTPARLGTRISVDGEPRDRDAVHLPIAIGSHEVCFEPVAGYVTPSCETVTVAGGQSTQVVGRFTDEDRAPSPPPSTPPPVTPPPTNPPPATPPPASEQPSPAPAPTPPGVRFVDVDARHPHAGGIAWARERRVTLGCTAERFCPGSSVTRGQMATFLQRAGSLPRGNSHRFTDVPAGHPHAPGIAAIAAAGITRGLGDGRFDPEGVVRRDQMATFLNNALDLPSSGRRFSDVASASPHADAIAAIAAGGITTGYPDDTYRPDGTVSRGQMTSFLERAYRDL
jgi:hypothetical protein